MNVYSTLVFYRSSVYTFMIDSIDTTLVGPVRSLYDVLSYADSPIARAVSFYALLARLILRSPPLLRLMSTISSLLRRWACLSRGVEASHLTKECI
jgi:hypothetical protein